MRGGIMDTKKSIILILFLIMLTVTACSSEPKVTKQTLSVDEQQVVPINEEEKEKVSYELTSDEIKLAEQYMKALDKVRISKPIAKAKPGDTLVLALAVKNKIGRENTFSINIEFRNGLSSSSSTLPVDKTKIQEWVAKNVYAPQIIKGAETKYLPLIVEVPVEGITSGNYIFDVIVKEKGEKSDHSYDRQELNVQVS